MSFRFFNSTGQEQIINSVADLPVGAIIDSALPNAPTGWLLCDGSSISRTGFPELFAAIGTFYGTVDANTFTLPDLTGQIIYARPYSLRTSNGLYVDDGSITSAKLASSLPKLKPNIVQTVKTTAFSTASSSFTDVTGLSAAITPRSSSSLVLVTVSIYTSNSGNNLHTFNLLRGSTNIAQPAADTYSGSMNASITSVSGDQTLSLTFLDSPTTTSATTYKIQMKVSGGTGYVCRRGDLASVTAASIITVQEIEQ